MEYLGIVEVLHFLLFEEFMTAGPVWIRNDHVNRRGSIIAENDDTAPPI